MRASSSSPSLERESGGDLRERRGVRDEELVELRELRARRRLASRASRRASRSCSSSSRTTGRRGRDRRGCTGAGSKARARRLRAVVVDALVDLVGDEPEAALAAEVEQALLLVGARDPAERVRGRGEQDEPRRGRSGRPRPRRSRSRYRSPASASGTSTGTPWLSATIAAPFGQAGERMIASSPGSMAERIARCRAMTPGRRDDDLAFRDRARRRAGAGTARRSPAGATAVRRSPSRRCGRRASARTAASTMNAGVGTFDSPK